MRRRHFIQLFRSLAKLSAAESDSRQLHKLSPLLADADAILATYRVADVRERLATARAAVKNYATEVAVASMLGEQVDRLAEMRLRAALMQIADRAKYVLRLLRTKIAKQSSGNTLSPPEVAREMKVSPDTVRKWIRTKQLRATNVANKGRDRWKIQRSELDRFMRLRSV